MKASISSLHYISPNLNHPQDYISAIERFCESGGDWVQLRMKDFPKSIILKTAQKAKSVCDRYATKLIINDHAEIANKVGAYGVHVGKDDQKAHEIRERYGDKLIIGCTANALEDILSVADSADYIGLGPFRFTETKKNLSPVLGLNGYSEMLRAMSQRGINLPVIAIGGIAREDLSSISETAVHGVAVSGLLHFSKDQKQEIQNIKNHFTYANHR